MSAPLFCVVVSDGTTETVWSSSPRSFTEAVKAAETCARCNPHKVWFAVSFVPGERHAVALGGVP